MPKRRIKLINPGVQLRICMTLTAVAAFCIVLQFALHLIAVNDASLVYQHDAVAMAAHLNSKVWDHLMLALWVLLPLSASVGIVVTFRITGPIFHLMQHMREVARGEDPGPLFFRKSDEFQDLPAVVNAALDRLRAEDAGAVFAPVSVEGGIESLEPAASGTAQEYPG